MCVCESVCTQGPGPYQCLTQLYLTLSPPVATLSHSWYSLIIINNVSSTLDWLTRAQSDAGGGVQCSSPTSPGLSPTSGCSALLYVSSSGSIILWSIVSRMSRDSQVERNKVNIQLPDKNHQRKFSFLSWIGSWILKSSIVCCTEHTPVNGSSEQPFHRNWQKKCSTPSTYYIYIQ